MMNKTCEICGSVGKYKCPTCLIFYCSVTCCRKHRENKCEVLIQKTTDETKDEGEEFLVKRRKIENIPSFLPEEKMEQLKTSEEVTKLLTNSHLRNLLVTVDNSQNPEEIMQKAMQEPIFVEFADACLKVAEPDNSVQTLQD